MTRWMASCICSGTMSVLVKCSPTQMALFKAILLVIICGFRSCNLLMTPCLWGNPHKSGRSIRKTARFPLMLRRAIFLGFFLHLWFFGYAGSAPNCTRVNPVVDSESEFTMVQHQLRGTLNITDDCSFRVSQFDMLSGSDVHWWGALAPDFENLTSGFIVSDHKLNQTYKNSSFDVHLMDNVSWSMFQVLAVWDRATASDFGHVVLRKNTTATAISTRPPTIFENCKVLSKDFRVRWSLNVEEDFIEIGLEAATGVMNYMAFGWANSSDSDSDDSELMIGADVAVAGFKEDGLPFVGDFFITKYSVCVRNSDGLAQGVCPDSIYEEQDNVETVNNTMLIYGHRRDGVSFVRYRRPLNKVDGKYDHPVNYTANMKVIWAMGLIKPPDTIIPYYLPENHGGFPFENYGHLVLNVSEHVNECTGPLDAEEKQDQDVIIADAKVPLVVSSGPAIHYPNPPNPARVIYINKKEAPLLRVERGVPVKFSVQAGHDVALYITSDPIGGNATLRNLTETVYAGGPEAQGVQSNPTELVWSPDRNTPDHIYYHSLYKQKMGWKVEVVDGGLSDMYNNSVVLNDHQVTLFWTLSKDSISIAVRGEKKSGYLAIGFGSGMVNSYAYVGWIDDNGIGHVSTYWIDGKDASSIHPTNENLTHIRCKTENGIITLEFTRPLDPSCNRKSRQECNNIIDPTTPLKVVWAMGAKWTNDHLTDRNMHSSMSNRPFHVLLVRGSAEAEQDLLPVLAVHGFMMFLAWGILLPGGILAARYLKHLKGNGWYQIHVYLQYSGLAIVLLALLFAVAELGGFYVSSAHVKFGFSAIFLVCIQPINAFVRPQKPTNGEQAPFKRVIWEYFHIIVGRCAIVVGIAALFSGMKHLGDKYDVENVHRLNWALAIWILVGVLIVFYLEFHRKQRKRDQTSGRSNWMLGNLEEDDSVNLLNTTTTPADKELHPSVRMEVQLEPLKR